MKILLVTWAWPPIGRIGALRPMGFAREWCAAGHEVHVLTGPGDRGGEFAPDLVTGAAETGAIVHRAQAPGLRPTTPRPASEEPPRMARAVPRWRQVLGQWRGFPDLQRSWIRPAVALGRELHRQHGYEIVWSSSPPESAHFVARGLAVPDLPWVADFRDQWSEYLLARWDPLSRWLIDALSARVLVRAAAVTANSEGVAYSVGRGSRRRVGCIRNGHDPLVPYSGPVLDRTLGYFGRVDPLFQHPERLWTPLRALRAADRPWRVRFFAAPGGGGGARIAVPGDLATLVEINRPVPHPQALRLMQAMTALLVLAWEVRGGAAPVAGKLYEYVGCRRPVLVCAPAHYEVRRLVESTGTGIGAWGDDEIAAVLMRLEAFEPSSEGRARLSRASSAAEMLSLFQRVIAADRAARQRDALGLRGAGWPGP